jgi:hypothetical protein
LCPFCDRKILLTDSNAEEGGSESSSQGRPGRSGGRVHEIPLLSPDVWEQALRSVLQKS